MQRGNHQYVHKFAKHNQREVEQYRGDKKLTPVCCR